MHPEQVKIYRSMTPAQKLDVSSDQIDFKVLDTKIKELLLEKEWATARNH
jgi:hypothetical protein